ncbi:MAG TPA: CYTH domain-containing protein [Rickettsiales bacterium]|nr:CYTH domain-containing protein [Rickettsiales bacterium]
MEKELEAKYFIEDEDLMREQLKGAGLECVKPKVLMRRKTFDTGIKGKWIRIRDEGNKTTMTFKNITGATINDVSEEETTVGSFDKACNIINQTDYKEKSFQENYREVWQNNEVEVVIDTWPYLKSYIEIEAKSVDIIKKYSETFKFNFSKDAFFGSVDVLYENQYKIPPKEFIKIPRITFNDMELKKILDLYKNNNFRTLERGNNV